MSYDQVAGASGGDDASSGGASQGGRGICRAFWFSHSAFQNSHSEFGCAKWVRKPIIISHNKFAKQIHRPNFRTANLHMNFAHEFCTPYDLYFFQCSAKISQGVRFFIFFLLYENFAECAKICVCGVCENSQSVRNYFARSAKISQEGCEFGSQGVRKFTPYAK